ETRASMYASTTHCCPASPMPRSRSIAGRATLTTVASRKTTVEAKIVAISVRRSRRLMSLTLTRRRRPRLRLGLVAELMRGGEEVPICERDRDQSGQRHAAEKRPEQDQLEAHRVSRAGAGEQHSDHRAREEDQPGGLGRVDQRDHPGPQAPTDERGGGHGGRGAEGER